MARPRTAWTQDGARKTASRELLDGSRLALLCAMPLARCRSKSSPLDASARRHASCPCAMCVMPMRVRHARQIYRPTCHQLAARLSNTHNVRLATRTHERNCGGRGTLDDDGHSDAHAEAPKLRTTSEQAESARRQADGVSGAATTARRARSPDTTKRFRLALASGRGTHLGELAGCICGELAAN